LISELLQSPPRCTRCNSPPINGQCTNLYDGPLLCGFNVAIKGLNTHYRIVSYIYCHQTFGVDRSETVVGSIGSCPWIFDQTEPKSRNLGLQPVSAMVTPPKPEL